MIFKETIIPGEDSNKVILTDNNLDCGLVFAVLDDHLIGVVVYDYDERDCIGYYTLHSCTNGECLVRTVSNIESFYNKFKEKFPKGKLLFAQTK